MELSCGRCISWLRTRVAFHAISCIVGRAKCRTGHGIPPVRAGERGGPLDPEGQKIGAPWRKLSTADEGPREAISPASQLSPHAGRRMHVDVVKANRLVALAMLPSTSTPVSLPQSHDSIFRPGGVHHQAIKPIVGPA